MCDLLHQMISKFQELKLLEKKYVLCSLIGLVNIDVLSKLQLTLQPINFKSFKNKISIPNIKYSENDSSEINDLKSISENFVDEILSLSIKFIKNEYLTSQSLDKFILNNNNEYYKEMNENINLTPIEHEHVTKLPIVKKSILKHRNHQNNAMMLVKRLSTELLSKEDKSKLLLEILCLEDWDIQHHTYQCINRRLTERWSMSSIPLKLLYNIFSYLSVNDLKSVSLVNKRWFSVARENNIWKKHCILFGIEIGFAKITEIIIENIGEEDSRINWLEIYKTIKKLFVKSDTESNPLRIDLKKQKLQFYNEIKSVKVKHKLCRTLSRKSISEPSSSRRNSKGLIKFNGLSCTDPDNDTRQLMKPIIGQLKQFQKSEEVAIDCKPSHLVSIPDQTNQSESKVILKWMDFNSEFYKTLNNGETRQIKKCLKIETCYKLTGHLDSVSSVIFDKYRMFTSSLDGSIRIWDSFTGRSIRKLYGHKGPVYTLDFYKQILISGGWDMSINVWSLQSDFSLIKMLYGHKGSITSVKISKLKEKIISASLDGTLRIYDIDNYRLVEVVTMWSRDKIPIGIIDMQIEDTRNLIATGHCDKSIKLTDIDRTECIYTIGYHKDVIKSIYFQSQLLISGGHSGILQFWDTNLSINHNNQKAQIQVLTEKLTPLSIDTIYYHSKSLWTGHNDGSIKEWHLGSMTCIRTLYGHKDGINSIYCFKDLMASASTDGSIRMWRLRKSKDEEMEVEKYQIFKERIPINCIFK